MLANGFRVGTASVIIFSSLFASGKLTTPLQLHVGLQFPGGFAAGWNTLPRVTPYSGQTGETPSGGSGDHLALKALAHRSRRGSTVCPFHVLPSVGCSDARPCLGNKLLSFLLLFCSNKTNS